MKELSKVLGVDIASILNEKNSWVLNNMNQSGGYAATKMEFHGTPEDKKDEIIKNLLEEIEQLKTKLYEQ